MDFTILLFIRYIYTSLNGRDPVEKGTNEDLNFDGSMKLKTKPVKTGWRRRLIECHGCFHSIRLYRPPPTVVGGRLYPPYPKHIFFI